MSVFACLLVAAVLLFQNPAPAPKAPPKPPDCSAPVHRQFDFWIGEWDVVPANAPNQKPATNIVTKEYGGCVIVEHWEAPGHAGSSFNIYDRTRGEWRQTWVDTTGGLHEYRGGLKDGNMVFIGDTPFGPTATFAGRRTIRLTFFPLGPDKVRQFSEAYMPDGTWTVNYDLIYTRRPKAVETRKILVGQPFMG